MQKKMKNMGENVFKLLNDGDPERIDGYYW